MLIHYFMKETHRDILQFTKKTHRLSFTCQCTSGPDLVCATYHFLLAMQIKTQEKKRTVFPIFRGRDISFNTFLYERVVFYNNTKFYQRLKLLPFSIQFTKVFLPSMMAAWIISSFPQLKGFPNADSLENIQIVSLISFTWSWTCFCAAFHRRALSRERGEMNPACSDISNSLLQAAPACEEEPSLLTVTTNKSAWISWKKRRN